MATQLQKQYDHIRASRVPDEDLEESLFRFAPKLYENKDVGVLKQTEDKHALGSRGTAADGDSNRGGDVPPLSEEEGFDPEMPELEETAPGKHADDKLKNLPVLYESSEEDGEDNVKGLPLLQQSAQESHEGENEESDGPPELICDTESSCNADDALWTRRPTPAVYKSLAVPRSYPDEAKKEGRVTRSEKAKGLKDLFNMKMDAEVPPTLDDDPFEFGKRKETGSGGDHQVKRCFLAYYLGMLLIVIPT